MNKLPSGKLASLCVLIALVLTWGIVRGRLGLGVTPELLFGFDIPLWLTAGFLTRGLVDLRIPGAGEQPAAAQPVPLAHIQRQGRLQVALAWVGGAIVLACLWFLPLWFSAVKLENYGIAINLNQSPLVVWDATAFLLGFYGSVILMIFAAAWKGIQKTTGAAVPQDLRKVASFRWASFWAGLKGVLGWH